MLLPHRQAHLVQVQVQVQVQSQVRVQVQGQVQVQVSLYRPEGQTLFFDFFMIKCFIGSQETNP